ncbi:MAG TPA: hypothetical protein VGS78_11745 [Candidatus Sulfotelmatobacter sp.]|nr:hypothetical protein [Candidatus Sulfotelmatobacter sp.]
MRLRAGLCFMVLMLQAAFVEAVQKQTAPGPLPAQIASARKVFIANGGENQPFSEDYLFSGGSERAYDDLYGAMKSWGKYELVGSPADADLLVEIELQCPKAGPMITPNFRGEYPYDPQFRLTIRDAKTNAVLWSVYEHVEWAILRGNRDKNFDMAMSRLVSDVQGLAVRAATVATAAKQ